MKRFLRGAALLAAAVAIATAAFLAAAYGYSLVVCRSSGEDPAGWALLLLLSVFLGEPMVLVPYLLGMAVAAATLRPALARFGVARVLGALALVVVGLVALSAGVSLLLDTGGHCSILG